MGGWTSQFKKPLEDRFAEQPHEKNDKIYVDRAAYGYFPMGAFLLLGDRQRNVRWFMDEVTEVKARFPRLQQIHFIGHSNGTYVLASALSKYRTLSVDRIVFAGSVVRRDFPWTNFRGRVKGGVRNYVGSADWVVGLFPKFFELPWLAAINPDLGSAGFNGFEDGNVKDGETQFIRGEHSAALVESNVQSVVDFILEGKVTNVESLLEKEHPWYLDMLSRVCWLVWIAIVLVVLALGWLAIACANGHLLALLTPASGQQSGSLRKLLLAAIGFISGRPRIVPSQARGWVALVTYCVAILYLLNTL